MLSSLFGRGQRNVARCTRIFLGPTKTIVMAMHRNAEGVYFEQAIPLVLPGSPTPAELGEAFASAFASFSVVRKSIPRKKRSDWPGFLASGCRSVKQFETEYIPVLCSSLNESNAVVRASVPHPANTECEIAWHFNPLIQPEAIGKGLLQLLALYRGS